MRFPILVSDVRGGGGVAERKNRKQFKPAIATMSLGKPSSQLDLKIALAARAGFQGLEIFWDDLVAYSAALADRYTTQYPVQVRVDGTAELVAAICRRYRIEVISLQPFRNYDGITCPEEHRRRLEEFAMWMKTAKYLGTDCIGVPATIDPRGHTEDRNAIARDMLELSRLAAAENIRVCYENLCFSSAIGTWEDAWDIVQSVAMDNCGFIPDTFNICGSSFADPEAPDGRIANARASLLKSLDGLRKIDPRKIPFIQVADGEKLAEPIDDDHEWMTDGIYNARMAWSRNARLFPLEEGGYLPVLDVLRALTEGEQGFRGFISLELFSRSTQTDGPGTVELHVARAWASWLALSCAMGWAV